MKKIEEFSDNELIEEIAKRFDHFIYAGRKDVSLKDGKVETCDRRRSWKGDYDVCVGLVMGTATHCLHQNWGVAEKDITDYPEEKP